MEAEFEVMNNNLKVWNLKLQKLKEKQEFNKDYLATSIHNLQITKESLEKIKIFADNVSANPKLINEIMIQLETEQEPRDILTLSSLPFLIPNLKNVLSKNPNPSFVLKLFDMVNDPNTSSVILWSRSGTSFFIKDADRLCGLVQEKFKHHVKTFYKTLNEYGFQCIDKYLCEYTNENFRRDNKDILKNIKSKRKLWAAKKSLHRDMEEILKRLGFFQNELKVSISNMKEKDQITKCDLSNLKRCLQSASKRITQKEAQGQLKLVLPLVDGQSQAHEIRMFKQDKPKFSIQREVQQSVYEKNETRPWLDPMKIGVTLDIGKLKDDLNNLNVEILNLEQGQTSLENQLVVVEEMMLNTERKQQETELSVNKLYMNPHVIPKRQRGEKGNNRTVGDVKKPRVSTDESSKEATNSNDHIITQEDLATNLESRESNHDPKKKDISLAPQSDYEGLMLWIGISEDELTFSY